jgi:hypothetical protein
MRIRTAGAPVAVLLALALPLSGCAMDATSATSAPAESAPSASAYAPRTDKSSQSFAPDPQGSTAGKAHDNPAWKHRKISEASLQTAAGARWFFAHQSVGGNVLKGVNALYKADGLEPPNQINLDVGVVLPTGGGFIADTHIGRNGHPFEKLADFDATLRGGLADNIDVAVLKFCYADVRSGRVDVDQLFQEYRRVLSALERDYPKVTFLYATVPLKADTPADNVARTHFNELVRAEYARTGRLWDIATIESTTPDGQQIGSVFNGEPYQALYPDYTRDGGHLYEMGTQVAAAPLLELIAKAVK